jgi:hypothetical protein
MKGGKATVLPRIEHPLWEELIAGDDEEEEGRKLGIYTLPYL